MTSRLLPVLLCLCASVAGAQPGQSPGPGPERTSEREQRKAELRTALKPNRQPELQNALNDEPTRGGRHLSPGERAEMRQQLRRSPNDIGRSGP